MLDHSPAESRVMVRHDFLSKTLAVRDDRGRFGPRRGHVFQRQNHREFCSVELPLLGRQFNPLFAPLDRVCRRIEHKVSDPKDRGLHLGATPQYHPDACQQFGKGERLDDVVIRARVESLDSVAHRTLGG
jgi:hypothetical protein